MCFRPWVLGYFFHISLNCIYRLLCAGFWKDIVNMFRPLRWFKKVSYPTLSLVVFFFCCCYTVLLFLCACLFSRYKCFRFLFFVLNNRRKLLFLHDYFKDFVSICLLRFSGLITILIHCFPDLRQPPWPKSKWRRGGGEQFFFPHPVSLPIIQICYNQKK